MAQLTGVNVNKLEGGLGRQNASTDNHVVFITSIKAEILATLPKIIKNKAIVIRQIEDLESIGFNESFDANNLLLTHYHISEIFRLAPDATVYFIANSKTKLADAIPDILSEIRANTKIKGAGFAGFEDTLVDLDVNKIQIDLVDLFTKENRDIDFVLLEGKPKADQKLDINTLENLREKKAPNVSVIISQDLEIASLDKAYKNHSAIGSALGMLTVRKISENMGSVNIEQKPRDKKAQADYPLTDQGKNRFVQSALSDGTNIDEISKVDLKTLIDKGYIFIAGYEGYAGFYFSGSTTAIEKASDYSTIENNRVWNAGKRRIREALIPYIKGKVKKDPSTGFIKSTTIATWQGIVNKSLEQMVISDDISGFEVYIDNKQIVNYDTPVKIKAKLVADGIVHEFDVDLGLTNSL